MPLSVVDLYKNVLPKTNCGDCGFSTCLAFASMVVSEELPLANCPHLEKDAVTRYQVELDEQQADGKWLKKDPAEDALAWAKERAASMRLEDLAPRIGGRLEGEGKTRQLVLPYFNDSIHIGPDGIFHSNGNRLNRWEQVFIYNHMAQGGSAESVGSWKSFKEFPNTVSKMKTMRSGVEEPLIRCYTGRVGELAAAGKAIGAVAVVDEGQSADLAFRLQPLPKVPVMLLFWDADPDDSFGAEARLLFDQNVTEHLDIESILFLSERIRQLLCEGAARQV